jgi:hypothetical protein
VRKGGVSPPPFFVLGRGFGGLDFWKPFQAFGREGLGGPRGREEAVLSFR